VDARGNRHCVPARAGPALGSLVRAVQILFRTISRRMREILRDGHNGCIRNV
jgi:hypothetical protein